jgi:hypothetical protein
MNPTDYGTAVTTGHDPTQQQPADGLDTLHLQTRRLVQALDLHRIPTDHGRNRAGQALTRAGVTWRTDNLGKAIAWRKNNPRPDLTQDLTQT